VKTENKTNSEFSFSLEAGKVACYQVTDGDPTPKRLYVADRLALAYDADFMTFRRLGPPSEVMTWAADERRVLREQKLTVAADALTVVLLPRGMNLDEYSRLLTDSSYFLLFLQKAGII
jgi:hypothetical protein